jgi:hypothetical protein
MKNSNAIWIRLLIIFFILFLFGFLYWLFYCQCHCRKTDKPFIQGDRLVSVSVTPNRAEGGKYPHVDTPEGEEPSNQTPAYQVPTGPIRGSLSPANNNYQLHEIKENAGDYSGDAAAGDPVVFNQYDQFGNLINSFGIPPDPSGARGGDVILYTFNTKAVLSVNGGANYTLIDPSTIFPSAATKDAAGNWLDGGLCCDQVIQYVPSIDRFIWLMQFCGASKATGGSCITGVNRVRIASASPQDIINSNATSWTYWDLLSSTFNLGNVMMDYPDLAVGDNSLYFSIDAVQSNGLFVARIPLNQVQNSQTINIDYTSPANGNTCYGAHLSQNTGNEIFWAGHVSSSKLRVFSLKEGENTYYWRDIDINSWPNGTTASIAKDGTTDWLSFGFPGHAAIGSARAGNSVWFAWTAAAGGGFPRAHIQMVQINVTNYTLQQQVQVWNNDYAFAYPALATNAAGELGMSLAWGGNQDWGNNAVGIWGDFIVWYPELSDTAISRWGDYLACRRASPNSTMWDASGYAVRKNAAFNVGYLFDVYYIQFGRNSDVNGGSDIK